jgi:glycosyltransferase involved in cell wall biosynthesis
MEQQLKTWRLRHPSGDKPRLFLMPGLRADDLPVGSGYVRVVLPYQSISVLRHWRVKQTATLPEPGNANTVLVQREAHGYSLTELESWLPRWKVAGGRLVFEIDDDLLDAKALIARRYKGDVNEAAAKVRYLAGNADLVRVSTEPLARLFQTFNQNIQVIPNALDTELWQLDRPRRHDQGPFRRLPNGPVRIGYIGTQTHDEDLGLVAQAMKIIERKYGDAVEIEVIGAFQNGSPLFGKRVGLPKKNDYPNFVRWLLERVHWDIGIIPLAENRFNESKSHLKFLEYAALDMAIAVSSVSAYQPVAKHRQNALIVSASTQDWIDAVSLLVESASLRESISQAARQEIFLEHTLRDFSLQI